MASSSLSLRSIFEGERVETRPGGVRHSRFENRQVAQKAVRFCRAYQDTCNIGILQRKMQGSGRKCNPVPGSVGLHGAHPLHDIGCCFTIVESRTRPCTRRKNARVEDAADDERGAGFRTTPQQLCCSRPVEQRITTRQKNAVDLVYLHEIQAGRNLIHAKTERADPAFRLQLVQGLDAAFGEYPEMMAIGLFPSVVSSRSWT